MAHPAPVRSRDVPPSECIPIGVHDRTIWQQVHRHHILLQYHRILKVPLPVEELLQARHHVLDNPPSASRSVAKAQARPAAPAGSVGKLSVTEGTGPSKTVLI